MPNPPKEAVTKINVITQAWSNLRPTKSFGGLTLEQCNEEVKPSLDVRAEIAEAEGKLQSATARRVAADEASMAIVRRVVSGVKADPEEGEDGELYAAMGFVRKSHRSSGLTRRRKDESGTAPQDVSKKEGAAS
jgi:hypothetical protein